MGLLTGNKSVLKFNFLAESLNILSPKGKCPWQLMNLLNSTEWMGKEPGSCRVIDVQQKQPVPVGKTGTMDHAEFLVLVGYRPAGWISDVKNDGLQRNNGWKVEVLDRRSDGTLLDGHGKPLPPGSEPVYLAYEMVHLTDYNDYDFGTFLGEEEGSTATSEKPTPQRVQVSETKTDCQLDHKGQVIDAMIHLIEVRYNDRIVVWNGVLQLTKDQMAMLGELDLMPIAIRLADGRAGFLHVTHGHATTDYYELAGVGKLN